VGYILRLLYDNLIFFIRRLLIVFLIAFLFAEPLTFDSFPSVIAYQQQKNREIQYLLDRVYGVERVMIDIKVNVSKEETIDSSFSASTLPGTLPSELVYPSIKNIYILDSYQVNVWAVPDITDQDSIEELVKNILDFDEYNESTVLLNTAYEKNGVAQTFIFNETVKGIKDIVSSINISIRVPEIANFYSTLTSNESLSSQITSELASKINSEISSGILTRMSVSNIIILLTGFLVLLLILVLFMILVMRPSKQKKGTAEDQKTDDKTDNTNQPRTQFVSQAIKDEFLQNPETNINIIHKEDKSKLNEEDIAMAPINTDLFKFIDESNIFKLSYVLKQDKPRGDSVGLSEYWQKIAIIVSFLPSHLSRILFMRYSLEEQTEIIPYLAYELDYPLEQINNIEKELKDKLDEVILVGGKRSVMPIFDNISNIKKNEIAKKLNIHHPDVLIEIRDMIILFEDVLRLPKDSLTKLLMDIDPNVVALAFIRFNKEEKNEYISGLAEGLRNIINEVIDLRKDNATDIEVQDATDTIIQYAKELNRKGVIKLNLKSFGEEEGVIDQNEIDKLFQT
jgi:flagellar motor switch protein FliG